MSAKQNSISPQAQREDLLLYWEKRAQTHGARAVPNLSHPESEFWSVTERQKKIIYPHFRAQLRGEEELVLDLGCGPGRFTADLAEMANGQAIGLDPIDTLLRLAPSHQNVSYILGNATQIPLDSLSVDIVWICLVLGTINDQHINLVGKEVQRVLRSDGLLFLIENTADLPARTHITFRSAAKYKSLFPEVALQTIGHYLDVKEEISILAGRKLIPN